MFFDDDLMELYNKEKATLVGKLSPGENNFQTSAKYLAAFDLGVSVHFNKNYFKDSNNLSQQEKSYFNRGQVFAEQIGAKFISRAMIASNRFVQEMYDSLEQTGLEEPLNPPLK
mgnify:CR=1 FL=1|jgi:hypothetical protein